MRTIAIVGPADWNDPIKVSKELDALIGNDKNTLLLMTVGADGKNKTEYNASRWCKIGMLYRLFVTDDYPQKKPTDQQIQKRDMDMLILAEELVIFHDKKDARCRWFLQQAKAFDLKPVIIPI